MGRSQVLGLYRCGLPLPTVLLVGLDRQASQEERYREAVALVAVALRDGCSIAEAAAISDEFTDADD